MVEFQFQIGSGRYVFCCLPEGIAIEAESGVIIIHFLFILVFAVALLAQTDLEWQIEEGPFSMKYFSPETLHIYLQAGQSWVVLHHE